MNSQQTALIWKQFHTLQKDPEPNWSVENYYPNDLSKWRVTFEGPSGTPYESGRFQLSLSFPNTYPLTPPEINFDTRIFHPNVDFSSGRLSTGYHKHYALNKGIRDLFKFLNPLICNPENTYFVNQEAAFLFFQHPDLFRKQAHEWTLRYATDEEIMSIGSSSLTPNEIISSGENSPRSVRACSPSAAVWICQRIDDPSGQSTEPWQSYPKQEQRALEHAYRSEVSMVDLGDKLIHFAQAIQLSEDDTCYHLKRNTPKNQQGTRRYQSLSFYSGKRTEDPIITCLLDPSVDTSLSSITAGIRHEGRLLKQEATANQLAEELEKFDQSDTLLIGLRCLHLYTRSSFLFSTLNKFLRQREFNKVDTLGPLCKAMYSQFEKNRTEIPSLKLYRGEELHTHDLRGYKRAAGKGSYQWLGFTSASKNEEIAKIFRRNAFFIIRLEKIYNDGRAIDISQLSQFKEEDEILFRPGVEFSIDKKYEHDRATNTYIFYLVVYI